MGVLKHGHTVLHTYLGTILRTSHFLGVDRILVTGARCELSCIVSKASVGALEVTPLWAVTRPVELLKSLAESGWSTVAASLSDDNNGPRGRNSAPVSSIHLSTLGSTIVVWISLFHATIRSHSWPCTCDRKNFRFREK